MARPRPATSDDTPSGLKTTINNSTTAAITGYQSSVESTSAIRCSLTPAVSVAPTITAPPIHPMPPIVVSSTASMLPKKSNATRLRREFRNAINPPPTPASADANENA